MTKVYEQAKDVHVRATYIYAKNADEYAYEDAANTVKIECGVLKDLFEKGAIVIADGVEYQPTSFKISAGVGTLTYVKADGTTPTTAVLATLVSKEHV